MSPASSVTFTSLKGSHSDSTSLYTLLDLLHPDSSNLPSFHLSFLDTIFYTGDNNVQYIYKVPSS